MEYSLMSIVGMKGTLFIIIVFMLFCSHLSIICNYQQWNRYFMFTKSYLKY